MVKDDYLFKLSLAYFLLITTKIIIYKQKSVVSAWVFWDNIMVTFVFYFWSYFKNREG